MQYFHIIEEHGRHHETPEAIDKAFIEYHTQLLGFLVAQNPNL